MIINIIDRVKHALSKDKQLSKALHDILGFYPHDLEIYRVALSHKSLGYRSRGGRPANNERLEFLGDAVLEAVVSDIVFHRYPRKREGFLTSTRSKIVQRTSLNKLSAELGIDRLIKTTAQPGTNNNNIGGNAFEALMGAVYLDRGYRFCKWFIEKRVMGRMVDIDSVAKKEVNFKSKLLEWSQKNRILSDFTFETLETPDSSSPSFVSTVVLEGIAIATGRGPSKKESQQLAAREALVRLRREPKTLDSVYRAKEQRTAMEAEEICALPHIEEIDREIAAERRRPQQGRRSKAAAERREQKLADTAKKEKTETAATAEAAAAAEEAPAKKSRRRSSRRGRRSAEGSEEAAPAAETAAPAETTTETAAPAGTAADEKAEKPRRNSRRRPRRKTENGEAPSAANEDIINQALEAAYEDA